MVNKTEIRARLTFWKTALEKLQNAYVALVEGGVKSYMVDDRQLTRLDIPALYDEIKQTEEKIDELTDMLNGRKPRKAFGVIPRDDW